jgi:hypothetical protein
MAAPTPTTSLNQMGKAFVASWSGVWAATGEFTDTIVVDLSALNYTNRIRILKIHIAATAGISATLEWDDASADELIYRHPLGVVGNIVLDYEPIGGLIREAQASADTGDIVLSTSSAATADEVSIVIVGRCA